MDKSPYRPSSSHRWLLCPGSVQSEASFPDTTSSYAEEGTAAHQLAEVCLNDGKNADEFLGEVFNGFEVLPEMAFAVQDYPSRS